MAEPIKTKGWYVEIPAGHYEFCGTQYAGKRIVMESDPEKVTYHGPYSFEEAKGRASCVPPDKERGMPKGAKPVERKLGKEDIQKQIDALQAESDQLKAILAGAPTPEAEATAEPELTKGEADAVKLKTMIDLPQGENEAGPSGAAPPEMQGLKEEEVLPMYTSI